jgi:hydroxymethylbilane synthase
MMHKTSQPWTENPENRAFVIGTRQSKLALWQANFIGALLQRQIPGFQYRLETFVTTGDRTLDRPLPEIGGKGLFTQELEAALHNGSIDLVVHSLKDLPVEPAEGLQIAAMPEREDARDVLIAGASWTLQSLPREARVGTSSLRRAAQLLHIRPDLKLLPIRGNVDTRIRKALDGEYDAVVLAAAGVYRLGLGQHVRAVLEFDQMLPAPGQGALAVQCRAEDPLMRSLLGVVDHLPTRLAVTAERAFLQGLGGGCSAPVAAYAQMVENRLQMEGLATGLDGQRVVRVHGACQILGIAQEDSQDTAQVPSSSSETMGPDPVEIARSLGQALACQALEQGARDLLPEEPHA